MTNKYVTTFEEMCERCDYHEWILHPLGDDPYCKKTNGIPSESQCPRLKGMERVERFYGELYVSIDGPVYKVL